MASALFGKAFATTRERNEFLAQTQQIVKASAEICFLIIHLVNKMSHSKTHLMNTQGELGWRTTSSRQSIRKSLNEGESRLLPAPAPGSDESLFDHNRSFKGGPHLIDRSIRVQKVHGVGETKPRKKARISTVRGKADGPIEVFSNEACTGKHDKREIAPGVGLSGTSGSITLFGK